MEKHITTAYHHYEMQHWDDTAGSHIRSIRHADNVVMEVSGEDFDDAFNNLIDTIRTVEAQEAGDADG